MGDSRVQQFVPLKKIGTSVKTKVSGDSIELDQDTWLKGTDYAGISPINILKVNTDNEIPVGATLIAGPIEGEEDSGPVTFLSMPHGDESAGFVNAFVVKLGGSNLIHFQAENDGSRGVQNPRVIVETCINLKEITTPTAKGDYGAVYTKSDNKLYFQDGAGTEHEIAFV